MKLSDVIRDIDSIYNIFKKTNRTFSLDYLIDKENNLKKLKENFILIKQQLLNTFNQNQNFKNKSEPMDTSSGQFIPRSGNFNYTGNINQNHFSNNRK